MTREEHGRAQTTDSAGHCADLLRMRDEDRWLAVQYAPAPLKRRLIALYALHTELRRVPFVVSEPPLGEIRLQWHRDALNEIREGKTPRRHPLVEELAAAGIADDAFRPFLDDAIDAAARPLYGEGFSSEQDFFNWLQNAEGSVDALAVKISGGDDALGAAARRAGAAYAAAREGRAMAPEMAKGIVQAARRIWRKEKPALAAAPAPCAPALAHLFLTPSYLARARSPFPVVKRLRLLSAIALGR